MKATAASAARGAGGHYREKQVLVRVIWTVIIGAFALTMIVPFLWMVSASLKRPLDVMKLPIDWIPDYWYPQNYMKVWNVGGVAARDYHFGLAYFNSLKIAFINLTGSVLTSTLAGYAFAKIKFRGSTGIFFLYLATMMIPSQVTLIPKFILFNEIGISGTHLTLILPGLITVTSCGRAAMWTAQASCASGRRSWCPSPRRAWRPWRWWCSCGTGTTILTRWCS